MDFNQGISLKQYADDANKKFDEVDKNLSRISDNFEIRMDGKTNGSLIGSFIGTLLWLAVFVAGAVIAGGMKSVNGTVLVIAVVAVLGLLVFMTIDNVVNFSYYGKISTYKSSVEQLQNRMSVGKNSIKSNHETFLKSKTKGWNHAFSVGSSIPDEASSIEGKMGNMEALKEGIVYGAKNVFYYAAVVMVTIVACMALFPVGGSIINGISGEGFSESTLSVFNTIAMIIAVIIEIFLAKYVWSEAGCAVTNPSLFIVLVGPLVHLALLAVATLVVFLVILVVQVVLYVIALVIGGVCLFGFLSGG